MNYGLDNIQNLIAACSAGDAAAATRFLDEGASPNGVRLCDGASAVYIASWHGHAEIVPRTATNVLWSLEGYV